MTAPRTRRWFVWNGRYGAVEPARCQLYAAREAEPQPQPQPSIHAELDGNRELELDNRISVRIRSAKMFEARRQRQQLLRGHGQYVAVELDLKRIAHIDGLLVLVHRMPHPHMSDPADELLVYRRLFSKDELHKARPADVDRYFNSDGKAKDNVGAIVPDPGARLASRAASLYRFSVWVAHKRPDLELPPTGIALPKESLESPMCVCDRSSPKKRPAPPPADALGRNLGVVDSLAALWRTLGGAS